MKKYLFFISALALLFSCTSQHIDVSSSNEKESYFYDVEITNRELSKEEYVNKTLGGLLGQFAGFLSGYEFVFRGQEPYIGLPENWFSFVNGPYAGNYDHYYPGNFAEGNNRYNRLRYNDDTKMYEVYSDDDFHIDIFNQTIIDEFGTSSYDIKEAWKKYQVSDWGGGEEAMKLISAQETLAPFSGTIEAGNRYGWCTEAYIENETLGMNAPGMSNVAIKLIDKFASNVGYFDSIIWAKFYGAMYSQAYFESDINILLAQAKEVLPALSYPHKMYDYAFQAYQKYPSSYADAANEIVSKLRPLYRIDNIQTDPNINGGFAILSFLYGQGDYLETCKYSSLMGYDGDCTSAICTGIMGVINGFKSENKEYQTINEKIYYDGNGVYINDRETGYPPHIRSKEYPTSIKINDIVSLFQKNFEKILIENGGKILEDKYLIPTSKPYSDHSLLFKNYDAEERNNDSWTCKNGELDVILESDCENAHSGWACFKFSNIKNGEVFHKFTNLRKNHYYRISTYVKTSDNSEVYLFANSKQNEHNITFANIDQTINKTMVFKADDSTMNLGFKFSEKASLNDYVIFDDFMVEEIMPQEALLETNQNLKLCASKYTKTLSKPKNITLGAEVLLKIEYRNYTSLALAKVMRNGNVFGGICLSKTSISSLNGSDYVEIPYVFEKDSDVIIINFDNINLYIGSIQIINQSDYMFR